MNTYYEDLIGRDFGRWHVLGEAEPSYVTGRRVRYWNCRCACGVERRVSEKSLCSGKSQSCGCLHSEIMRSMHGTRTTHGQADTRLYRIYRHMINRCYNPHDIRYPLYGERGIKICDEWSTFEKFFQWAIQSGYADDLSIDRINVDGDYCPENCRWATNKEQAMNRRSTIMLEYNGKKQSITEWAEELNMPYKKLHKRIYSGWDVERALTT